MLAYQTRWRSGVSECKGRNTCSTLAIDGSVIGEACVSDKYVVGRVITGEGDVI